MRRPTNAGLTMDQANRTLKLLRHMGQPQDTGVLAEHIGASRPRMANFLKTLQARRAILECTPALRSKFDASAILKAAFGEDIGILAETSQVAVCETDIYEAGLTVKASEKEARRLIPNRKTERQESGEWLRDHGCDLSDSEIAMWDRLADGKLQ